jgi:cobalt-zinc-cadmium efflux system protein
MARTFTVQVEENKHVCAEECSHDHYHAVTNLNRAFKLGFCLTVGLVAVQFGAGIASGSVALLADAGHNFSDALALAFSAWAIKIARRAPNHRKTFGYHRAASLAALVNSFSLLLIAVQLIFAGVQAWLNPAQVNGWTVIWVASVGLVINLLVAGLLHGWSKADLNTRSAFLHVAWDAVASAGVIVAGICLLLFGWGWVDGFASVGIGLMMLFSGGKLFKKVADELLEAIPPELDTLDLLRELSRQPGVLDIHDLHVWAISRDFKLLSCHVQVEPDCNMPTAEHILQNLLQLLKRRYGIDHATLQIETHPCNFDHERCAIPPH